MHTSPARPPKITKPLSVLSRRKLFACLIGFVFSLQATAANNGHSSGQWRTGASVPQRIQEIYPAVFRQHIVVAGGLSPDPAEGRIGVSDRVFFFDLKAQSWQEGAPLPEPRHHPMLVVVDNRLLSFGGFTQDKQGMWHNSVDVLELIAVPSLPHSDVVKSGRWEKIAEMPMPLAETLGEVHRGLVHLVSGRTPPTEAMNSQWSDQIDVGTHFIFDPESLGWSQGPAVPTARNSACSVKMSGQMHTIGGRTVAGGNLATHEAYNFHQKTWKTLAPLPEAQGGLACAAVNQRIYVFGGEFFDNGGGVYADVWEYDPGANAWGAVSIMPDPRHGLGALSVDGSIYVIAGAFEAGGNKTSNAMTIFTPSGQ